MVPAEVTGTDAEGNRVQLRKLWLRRQTTKFNGASYVIQRGAEALYTAAGQEQIRRNVDYYLRNAGIIRDAMLKAGFKVYGGLDSPYVWVKSPAADDSWKLFETLLEQAQISCTPGVGFGSLGQGWIRFTGFNTEEKTREAMKRLETVGLG